MSLESQIKILLVDDELSIREACCQILNKKGYNVVTAENGDEALKEIKKSITQGREGEYNILITDFKMPGMDGHELSDRVKEEDQNIYIILMSGNLLSDEFKKQTNVSFYLPKPYEMKDLLEAVEYVKNIMYSLVTYVTRLKQVMESEIYFCWRFIIKTAMRSEMIISHPE